MRPCVEKMQGLFVCKKSWLHITKTLCLCGFPLIKVNYPIRNLWDNYRKKYWKKKVKIGVKSTNMAGGYLRKIRGIGYEWSDKMNKSALYKALLCIYRLLCYQIDTNNIENMFPMRNWMCISYLILFFSLINNHSFDFRFFKLVTYRWLNLNMFSSLYNAWFVRQAYLVLHKRIVYISP